MKKPDNHQNQRLHQEATRKRLEALPRKKQQWFTWRCAVRVLPVLGAEGNFDFWKEDDRQKYLMSIFWAIDTAAANAANAANAAANAAANVANAAAANKLKKRPFHNVTYKNFVIQHIRDDLKRAENHRADELFGTPLWQEEHPVHATLESAFAEGLKKERCDYWFDVYRDNRDGKHDPEKVWARLKVPEEIRGKGAAATATYLLAMEKENTVKNREVKVVFLGEGGVGKTSLVRRLKDRTAELPGEKDATAGVDTTVWQPESSETKARLWDFGGQVTLHATHRLFLAKRNVYVVLSEPRRNRDLEYWLAHAEQYGGNSPVLIVVNKIDTPNVSIDRLPERTLREKHPTIQGFYYLSCKKVGKGLDAFEAELVKTLETTEGWETGFPASWFRVKEKLERMDEACISYDEYQNICGEQNISQEETKKQLLHFLHDLGIALYYPEADLEMQVLNPGWLTAAIYQIIVSPVTGKKLGRITESDLEKILDYKKYPKSTHGFILKVMKEFELCFHDTQDEKNEWIIPDRLPEDQPPSEKLQEYFEETQRFRYIFGFLPPQIIHRLMVRLSKDLKVPVTWRNGAVLENEYLGSTAVIIADRNDRTIDIYAKGKKYTAYLSRIRNELEAIFDDFDDLRPDEKIALPQPKEGQKNKTAPPAEWYDYGELIRKEVRVEEIFYDSKNNRYRTTETLNRIEPPEVRMERRKKESPAININIYGAHAESKIGDVSQEQTTLTKNTVNVTVSVDVKNECINRFDTIAQNIIDELGIDPPSDAATVVKELETLKAHAKELENSTNKDDPANWKAMDYLTGFVEKVTDKSTRIGRVLDKIEGGARFAGGLIDQYNRFGPWFGALPIPNPFSRKNKSQ